MIVQTIHEPPEPAADKLDRAAALAFIRDGFSFVAALLAPVWMLFSGVWIGTLVYVAALALLATLFSVAGWDLRWYVALILAAHLLVGFEAASLRRWALERRGWRLLGTVAGRNAEECERRFFESWLPGQVTQPAYLASLDGTAVTNSGSGLRFARLRRLFRST